MARRAASATAYVCNVDQQRQTIAEPQSRLDAPDEDADSATFRARKQPQPTQRAAAARTRAYELAIENGKAASLGRLL